MTYYTTAFKRAEDLAEDDVIKINGQWPAIKKG